MTVSQKKVLRSRIALAVPARKAGDAGKKLLLFGFVVIALCWFGTLQAKAVLELKNEAFQEVLVKGPDGKEERKTVPAAMVVPGTEVQYVVTYRNAGAENAGQIAITNPIPKELEYISAANAEVSVDEGKNYGELATLKVVGADGKLRPATPSDVTHVRWLVTSLKAGDEGKVSFRARLK